MRYLPNKKVYQKLIKFATLVKDPLSEINHLEVKYDPDQNKALGKMINPIFNDLRVLPPKVLTYPDL